MNDQISSSWVSRYNNKNERTFLSFGYVLVLPRLWYPCLEACRTGTDFCTSTISISPFLTVFYLLFLDNTCQYLTDLKPFTEKEKTKKGYIKGS